MSGTVPLASQCVLLPRSPLELTLEQQRLEGRLHELEARLHRLEDGRSELVIATKLAEVMGLLRATTRALQCAAAENEELHTRVARLEELSARGGG